MKLQQKIVILWEHLSRIHGTKKSVYEMLGGVKQNVSKVRYILDYPKHKDEAYMQLVLNAINQVLKNTIKDCTNLQELIKKLD